MGADEDAERARKVMRAYQLHGQRWSSRDIGAELGVSHMTAQRWIEEYRQALEWHETHERAGRRARMVGFLDELARRGIARLEERDEDGEPVAPWEVVTPVLLKVAQEINRVEGNYAPVRVATEDDRRPPDPALVAAMREEAARASALDEDETRRELEQ